MSDLSTFATDRGAKPLPEKLPPHANGFRERMLFSLNFGGGKSASTWQIYDEDGDPMPIVCHRGSKCKRGFVISGVCFEDPTRLFDVVKEPRYFPSWAAVVAYWPAYLKALKKGE